MRQKAQEGMSEVIIDQGAKMVCEDRKCRLCGHGDAVLHGKDERAASASAAAGPMAADAARY